MALTDAVEQGVIRPVYLYDPKMHVVDDGTYVYIGEAKPGTATSAAKWRCVRVTKATGIRLHANGRDTYENIADNITFLNYL